MQIGQLDSNLTDQLVTGNPLSIQHVNEKKLKLFFVNGTGTGEMEQVLLREKK